MPTCHLKNEVIPEKFTVVEPRKQVATFMVANDNKMTSVNVLGVCTIRLIGPDSGIGYPR